MAVSNSTSVAVQGSGRSDVEESRDRSDTETGHQAQVGGCWRWRWVAIYSQIGREGLTIRLWKDVFVDGVCGTAVSRGETESKHHVADESVKLRGQIWTKG